MLRDGNIEETDGSDSNPLRIPSIGDLSALDPLQGTLDWESFLEWPLGVARCHRWSSQRHPEVQVPVFQVPLQDGGIGCAVWQSSAVLAEFVVEHVVQLLSQAKGANATCSAAPAILDIGCGCGLGGAAAMAALLPGQPPAHVIFCDLFEILLEAACATAKATLKFSGARCEETTVGSFSLDWLTDPETWVGEVHGFDLVVASDANDQRHNHLPNLACAFDRYAKREHAVVIDVNPDTRLRLEEFRHIMVSQYGFVYDPASTHVAVGPHVPGLSCGASRINVDVYRR